MNQEIYYSLVLDILCVTYFLASVTMPDPQTSDMHRIRQIMSALSLASGRLNKKLWILAYV